MRPMLTVCLALSVALIAALAASRDAATNPLATITRHAPAPVEGIIAQRLSAGSYTYITLAPPADPTWIVVMGAAPEPGQHIQLTRWGQADRLRSQRLQRDFAPLSFATKR